MSCAAIDCRVITLVDVAPQPWRNGGGVTRELLAWPTLEHWQLRVSVADIERDGPFSAYPGVTRWFCVLQGAGVELNVDGALRCLRSGDEPLAFDGGAATTCRLLDGPTRDLNLMLRNRPGGLLPAVHALPWRPADGACALFTCVAGRLAMVSNDVSAMDVPAQCLVWFDAAPSELRFDAAAPTARLPAWWLWAGREGASA